MCDLSHHYVSGDQIKDMLDPANYQELLNKDAVLVVCRDSGDECLLSDIYLVFEHHNAQETVNFLYATFSDGFTVPNEFASRVCLQIQGTL